MLWDDLFYVYLIITIIEYLMFMNIMPLLSSYTFFSEDGKGAVLIFSQLFNTVPQTISTLFQFSYICYSYHVA